MFIPASADAQVVISEIMYDAPGSEGSGDHDWVEVFNAGPNDVDLSTYRFFEAGTNHTLKSAQGSVTLAVGAYAIIANIPATFLADYPSYSGALFDSAFNLNSSGELIGMRTGDLADTEAPFAYVPLDAASNNGSSLQRSAVASATFAAAAPTPGAGALAASGAQNTNTTTDTNTTATTTTQATTTQQTSQVATVPSYVSAPPPQIFADAGGDRSVIVGADVEFDGRAYNRSQEIIDNVRFSWNFGDGTAAEGSSVSHHFDYPGRYAVILNIAENRSAASDKIIVTAEPALLSFTALADGGIAIENRSGHDLDMSRWIVRNFGREFALKEHTEVLEGETLRISSNTLGFFSGLDTELAYPNGALALRVNQGASPTVSVPVHTPLPQATVITPTPLSYAIAPKAYAAVTPAEEIIVDTESATTTTQTAAVAPASEEYGGGYTWLVGTIVLTGVTAGVIAIIQRSRKKEWQIIEDTSD